MPKLAHPLMQGATSFCFSAAAEYSALTGWRSLLHWTGFVVTREASIPNQRACFNPAKAKGLYPKSYKDTTKTHSKTKHNQWRVLYYSLNKDTIRSVRHQLEKHSFKSHHHVSQLGHSQGLSALHLMPQCIAQIRKGKQKNRLKSHFALCLAPELHSPLVMII